jgi:hypothetical protein
VTRAQRFARLWRYEALKERRPLVAAWAVAFLAGAAVLVFSTSGALSVGGGERSAEERLELLAGGDCAVLGGQPLGRILGILTPSQGIPERRYQVALLDRHRVVQVNVDEVQIVSCPTLVEASLE